MKKIHHTKQGDRLLIIWETRSGNYVGEVYQNEYKRGKWIQRATFYANDGDADIFRVKEYFNFT